MNILSLEGNKNRVLDSAKVSLDNDMVLVCPYVHTYVHKHSTVGFSCSLKPLRTLPISSHKNEVFING